MAIEQEFNEVKLQVGLLNKDIQHTNLLCDKLSESIEKIQEMNMNLIKMIALHENKHEQHERVEDDLRQDYKELHSRITTINREIHDRIDQVEHHITERIDALRSDLTNHKTQDKAKLGDRLANVEQWKWMVVGAIGIGAWLLGNLDVIGKFLK
jgi:chromosome segregation ATPase